MLTFFLALFVALVQENPLVENYLFAALITRSFAIEEELVSIRSCRHDLKIIRENTRFTGEIDQNFKGPPGTFKIGGAKEKPVFETQNKKTQKEAIEYYENKQKESLAKLDKLYEDTGIPVLAVGSLSKGDIGFLGRSQTLLAEIKILQVISDSKLLVTVDDVVLMLSGLGTTGLTDGSVLDPKNAFVVAGTESYTALNGAKRTVLLLEYVPREKLLEIHASAQKIMPKRPRQYREWKSLNGGFTVSAEYQHDDGKAVTLLKENGSTVVVPITKLSKEDRQWLENESHK